MIKIFLIISSIIVLPHTNTKHIFLQSTTKHEIIKTENITVKRIELDHLPIKMIVNDTMETQEQIFEYEKIEKIEVFCDMTFAVLLFLD